MAGYWAVEYTDTFGGEANYSWVRRANVKHVSDESDLAVMRRAKKAMGLNGVRGRSSNLGDTLEFRPFRSCTVMFASFHYDNMPVEALAE